MQEKLITFETAKLAKEKGWKKVGVCLDYYKPDGTKMKLIEYNKEFAKFCIQYCTQSLLQKWLREVHRTDITVITDWKQGVRVYYVGFSFVNTENKIDIWFSKDENNNKIEYSDYEEALEIALQEALKLIK